MGHLLHFSSSPLVLVSEQIRNGTCATEQIYAQHLVAGVGQAEALLREHVDTVEVDRVEVGRVVVGVEVIVGVVVVVVRQLQALEILYGKKIS